MKEKEITQITIAILVLGFVSGFMELIRGDYKTFSIIVVFGAIIIAANIISKKSIMAGVIIPLFVTIITLGGIKLMSILTYETRALKRRAAKRFGPYSFTEMTDYHNALVGAVGIVSSLLITFITYWLPGSYWGIIGRMATFYAFFNLIPFSKLDGSQIYFGSRVLWSVLAVITLIFMMYAMLLV